MLISENVCFLDKDGKLARYPEGCCFIAQDFVKGGNLESLISKPKPYEYVNQGKLIRNLI
jgi:hypothetical protein